MACESTEPLQSSLLLRKSFTQIEAMTYADSVLSTTTEDHGIARPTSSLAGRVTGNCAWVLPNVVPFSFFFFQDNAFFLKRAGAAFLTNPVYQAELRKAKANIDDFKRAWRSWTATVATSQTLQKTAVSYGMYWFTAPNVSKEICPRLGCWWRPADGVDITSLLYRKRCRIVIHAEGWSLFLNITLRL